MTTLADQLVRAGGRPTGFDYLRIGLALSILVGHSVAKSNGLEWAIEVGRTPWRALIALFVPMFFAVSGFLVAASLDRTPALPNYLGLRALRIFPGLTTEVVLSALILGPICTSLPLALYFSSPEFGEYFFNIIGYVHYRLPGVFENNPFPEVVNGQLWTVPFELASYTLLGLLGLFGIVRNRWLFLIAVIASEIVALAIHINTPRMFDGGVFGAVGGFRVAHVFFAAALLYAFRDRVPMSLPLFIVSAAASAVLLSNWRPIGDYLVSFPLAYATVYLGLLNPPKNVLIAHGDFSYGIYLYGTPLGQFVASWGAWTHVWWINVALALPMTVLAAIFSWFAIEKPALGLRRFLVRGNAEKPNANDVRSSPNSCRGRRLTRFPFGTRRANDARG